MMTKQQPPPKEARSHGRQRRRRRQQERQAADDSSSSSAFSLLSSKPFQFLLLALGATFLVSTELLAMLDWHHDGHTLGGPFHHHQQQQQQQQHQQQQPDAVETTTDDPPKQRRPPQSKSQPHLVPQLPYLPAFPTIPNAEQLMKDTLNGQRPTLAGITSLLYSFLEDLHASHQRLAAFAAAGATKKQEPSDGTIRQNYYQLASERLVPLDRAYRGGLPFDVRRNEDGNNEDSIFVSVAAYREHLLVDTLTSLFQSAARPDRLFVGVVVNNCFGPTASASVTNNTQLQKQQTCRGGVRVVGQNKQGRDVLASIEDEFTPDVNGVELFCTNATFAHYCQRGHVRVLYVHEVDALGPAAARYYASKLWAGETYFIQVDAHLKFATHWDALYIQELKACRTFPKAVLSTYPPGFVNFRQDPPFTPGTRLCQCRLRSAEGWIPRVEMQGRCHENQTRPTQMAFIGAGFFMAHATFLADVPFDPFLPWIFMGEEVALSVRAWTHGYNIYAPRQNLIGHQYRPISMGNPHFQDTLSKLFPGRPALITKLQRQVRKRIKYLMGYYPDRVTNDDGGPIPDEVLTDIDYYGVGQERTVKEYLEFAEIDLDKMTCGIMTWCTEGTLD